MRSSMATPATVVMLTGIAALVLLLMVLVNQTEVRGDSLPVFKSPCGSAQQVSLRLANCLQPIYNVILSRTEPYPSGDKDLIRACNQFNVSDKCVRSLAKECLQGVHKTVVGTVASAIKRFRIHECKSAEARSKYLEPLQCIHKNGNNMELLMRKNTGLAEAVRDQKIPPEKRLMEICCLFEALDRSVEDTFGPKCPKEVPGMLAMIHSMTDDARNTVCVRPKCEGVVENLVRGLQKLPNRCSLEPLFQIIFAV